MVNIRHRVLSNVVNSMALPRIKSLLDLIMVLIAISLIYLFIIISIFKKTPKKEKWLFLKFALGSFGGFT